MNLLAISEKILWGVGSVWYVGVVFCILFYGYISTYGNEFGSEKICVVVDKAYDFWKWFIVLIFVSGFVVGWKTAMLSGAWTCATYLFKLRKNLVA